MEQNYRLTIAYDGSRFFGWERQPDKDTIQGKLETVLGALQGHPVNVIGAGRTDAGVHARAMTANVVLDVTETPDAIRDYLNRYLPDAIAVREVKEAAPRFHARYNALGKTYRYAGIGSRANSAFAYVSPNFGGFTAAAAYVSKNDVGANVWDLGLMYNNGPIAAGLSANKVSGGKTNYQLGGKYSFGNFAVAASYNQASQANLRRRGASIGGTATFGATSVTLDLTRDTKNEWTGKKYTNGVVEAKYALSKRTFVYGAFLRYDGDNNYGVGVRHNF